MPQAVFAQTREFRKQNNDPALWYWRPLEHVSQFTSSGFHNRESHSLPTKYPGAVPLLSFFYGVFCMYEIQIIMIASSSPWLLLLWILLHCWIHFIVRIQSVPGTGGENARQVYRERELRSTLDCWNVQSIPNIVCTFFQLVLGDCCFAIANR